MKHRQLLRTIVLVSGCVTLLSSVASAENPNERCERSSEKIGQKRYRYLLAHLLWTTRGSDRYGTNVWSFFFFRQQRYQSRPRQNARRRWKWWRR